MKKNNLILTSLLSFTLIVFVSFSIGKPDSTGINEEIKVDNFSSVEIAVPARVSLEQSEKCFLDIEASPETMKKIEAVVEDGSLIIKKKDKSYRILKNVRIRITAPDIEAISISGSADIVSELPFSVDELMLKISGSGNLLFADLKSDELGIKIAGSGDVKLAGKGADEMALSIAGSGNLDAIDFEVGEFDGKVSGSGDCVVFVNDELNASITGSGSVLYKGRPIVNSVVAGSGKVKAL